MAMKHAGQAKHANVKGSNTYGGGKTGVSGGGDNTVEDVGAGREAEHTSEIRTFAKDYFADSLKDSQQQKIGLGNEPGGDMNPQATDLAENL